MKRHNYFDVFTILNRIKLTIWPICAFQVLNPHQWSLVKQSHSKSCKVVKSIWNATKINFPMEVSDPILFGGSVLSSPEPKARVSYCHSAPSVRHRPSSSVRKLFTFSTSSPKPLGGFWWNLVGMMYSWSLTSVVVFRSDPPRGRSRARPK